MIRVDAMKVEHWGSDDCWRWSLYVRPSPTDHVEFVSGLETDRAAAIKALQAEIDRRAAA